MKKAKFEDVIGILDELSRSDHRNAEKASRLADYVDEITRTCDSSVGTQRTKGTELNEVMRFVQAACSKTEGWRSDPNRVAEDVHGCLASNETLELALPGYILGRDGVRQPCIAMATDRQILRVDDDGDIHPISYSNIQEIVGEDRDDLMEMRASILRADDGRKLTIKTTNLRKGHEYVEFVRAHLR